MPRWVTIFGPVNHLGAEPGTQAYSAWPCPLRQAGMSTGGVNMHIAWHQPVSVVSQCSLIAWLTGIASEDQRRLTGSGSALEACSRRCSIQMTAFTLLYFPLIPLSMNKHRHSPTSRITMVKAIVIRDGYGKVKVTLLYFPLIPISMNKHRHAPTSRLLRSW